jgi:DNA-binding NarL/FixJ family response regulator
VLIAEDEALVRLDVRATLESVGLAVCGEAADGQEAVTLAAELEPDLVVIDASMPRLDGVEAARRILETRAVPIVMLTGYGYGDLIARALDAGVAAYVVKPFPEHALLEAVATVLRGGHTKGTLAYLRRTHA